MTEIRKVGRQDINYGASNSTWASTGGTVLNYVPYPFAGASGDGSAIIDVRAYGAIGNGSTDDTAAIQAAIDAANAAGGGVVYLPPGTYKCIDLILKTGVVLVGSSFGIGYLPDSVTRTKLLAASAGIIVDTPVAGASLCGVMGIDFQGLGSGTAVKGLRVRTGSWNQFKNLHFNNLSDEAILQDAGLANVYEDILVINSVLNRTRSAIIGAVDISGTDHYIHRVEATISGSLEGTVQSASLYCIGILLRGTNCWITDSVGEISDIGIYISGDLNRLTGARADRNYGHGFYVTGSGNAFSNCLGLSNSQDTTNTYDNWNISGANNIITGCYSASNLTKVHRYGFYDTYVGADGKNKYFNCHGYNAGTIEYKMTAAGSYFDIPEGPFKTFTAGDTTPSVLNNVNWITNNAGATTITNFDDGNDGQRLHLRHGGAGSTTIKHGINIYTNTGADKALDANKVYVFINSGGFWFEN